MIISTFGVIVYAVLEYTIRIKLNESNQILSGNHGKQTSSSTVQYVFNQCYNIQYYIR